MTIAADDQTSSTPPPSDNGPSGTTTAVAKQAASEASDVAGTAVDAGRQVASDAAGEVKAVASQAKDHALQLVGQTKSELVDQAQARGKQAADGLRTLSDQLGALGDGRPEDAGPLGHYLGEAQAKVASFAERLDQGGPQGLLDDVTSFARRKPGLFLAGAVGAGFLVGRLVRSGAMTATPSAATPVRLGSDPRSIGSGSSLGAPIAPASAFEPTPLNLGGSAVDGGGLP